jgi:Tfp pilus assembly protein FimV
VGRGAETTHKLKDGDRTAKRLMGAAVARKQQIDPTCRTPSQPTHQIESPTPGKANHITTYNSCALTAHAGREETLEKCPYPRPLCQNRNLQDLIVGG